LDLHVVHGLPFYDAMIVQAALDSSCRRLWSEDLQSGRSLGGLSIANPFAPVG
jgi:predicted nucleic acid-binding protein